MSATAPTTQSFSTTTTSPPPPTTQQQMYPNLKPPAPASQGVMYPVASSGRGFIPKPSRPNSDQTVTVANPPPRPNPHILPSYPPPNHHHHVYNHHPFHQPPVVRGIPVSSPHPPKVAPSPSASDTNGYKNLRDKKEETVFVIKDRKVRISEEASLYALCRSWLRNGYPEETQPQYGDGVKSLPRPLPMPVSDTNSVDKKESEEESNENEEDEASVSQLSAQELLKRHVNRAKRVRSKLREERTKRIERFKTRLGLLLPPLVEPLRNDVTSGN